MKLDLKSVWLYECSKSHCQQNTKINANKYHVHFLLFDKSVNKQKKNKNNISVSLNTCINLTSTD